MMRDYLKRLERIESTEPRFPWERVCRECAAKGLTSTPESWCEAKRCDERNRNRPDVDARLTPEVIEAIRIEFETACRMHGEDPAEAMGRAEAEARAKRDAWEARKQEMRKAANA